jgi:hypothetical protein
LLLARGLGSSRLVVPRLRPVFSVGLSSFFFSLTSYDHGSISAEIPPQLHGVVVIDRAGMGQSFGDAEVVQFIDDLARFNFELPRQLIDSDLTHV